MEIRCYRKILYISYKDHVTNKEVRAKIQQAIGPLKDLLTTVKRRKLQWYGHVPHSKTLAVKGQMRLDALSVERDTVKHACTDLEELTQSLLAKTLAKAQLLEKAR